MSTVTVEQCWLPSCRDCSRDLGEEHEDDCPCNGGDDD